MLIDVHNTSHTQIKWALMIDFWQLFTLMQFHTHRTHTLNIVSFPNTDSVYPLSLCGFEQYQLYSKLPDWIYISFSSESMDWFGMAVEGFVGRKWQEKLMKNFLDHRRRFIWGAHYSTFESTTGMIVTLSIGNARRESVEKHNSCDTLSNIYHDYCARNELQCICIWAVKSAISSHKYSLLL